MKKKAWLYRHKTKISPYWRRGEVVAGCIKGRKTIKKKSFPPTKPFRACLHEGGGTRHMLSHLPGVPHLTCKRNYIKMRDYMDRRVTSPTWGAPPHCKQALNLVLAKGRFVPSDFSTKHSLHLILDNFENKCFLALGFTILLCPFDSKTWKLAAFFPPSVTPLSSILWSHAVKSRAGYNYWIVSRSGCIRILSRSLDQESTNDSPCVVV